MKSDAICTVPDTVAGLSDVRGQTNETLNTMPFICNGAYRHGLWPAAATRSEAFFVRHRNKLLWVHVTTFVFFLAIILLPLYLPEAGEDATPLNSFTQFANFAMWGLWFPLLFLSVIFSGRSWCGLFCPMGATSEWANINGLQQTIPAWVRWEGTPIISFLIITVIGQTVGVRDHPEAMAEIFGGTLVAAILFGFVYGRKKRAWCRHMCPIGLLLGVFSRIGIVQFAPKRPRAGGDRYTEKTVCPTMIDISRKEESRHCIECFRCVQPEARGGLFLRLRHPGEEIEQIRKHHPNIFEVWFLFMGTGIALGGFLWLVLPQYQMLRRKMGEWMIENGWFWIGESGPWWLMSVHPERREIFNWLDFFSIVGFMLGCMVITTLILAATTASAAWLSGRLGGDTTFNKRFVELGYQYSPVAMVSLVIGLGATLFEPLSAIHVDMPHTTKLILFIASILWSLRLSEHILSHQGITPSKRWIAHIPGLTGSLVVGTAWWPGIFGL